MSGHNRFAAQIYIIPCFSVVLVTTQTSEKAHEHLPAFLKYCISASIFFFLGTFQLKSHLPGLG